MDTDLDQYKIVTSGRAICRMMCRFFQHIQTADPLEIIQLKELKLKNAKELGDCQAKWDCMLLQMQTCPPSQFKLVCYKAQVGSLEEIRGKW